MYSLVDNVGLRDVPPAATAVDIARKLIKPEIHALIESVSQAQNPQEHLHTVLHGLKEALNSVKYHDCDLYPHVTVPLENTHKIKLMESAKREVLGSFGDKDPLYHTPNMIELASVYNDLFEKQEETLCNLIKQSVQPMRDKVYASLYATRVAYLKAVVDAMHAKRKKGRRPRVTWKVVGKALQTFSGFNSWGWNVNDEDYEALFLLYTLPGIDCIKSCSHKCRQWGLFLYKYLINFKPCEWALQHGFTHTALVSRWLHEWSSGEDPLVSFTPTESFDWSYWFFELVNETTDQEELQEVFQESIVTALDRKTIAWDFMRRVFIRGDAELYKMLCHHPVTGVAMNVASRVFTSRYVFDELTVNTGFATLLYHTQPMVKLILNKVGLKEAVLPPTLDRNLMQRMDWLMTSSGTLVGVNGSLLDRDPYVKKERRLWVRHYLWERVRWLVSIRKYAFAWLENHEEIVMRAEFANDGTALVIGKDAMQLRREYETSFFGVLWRACEWERMKQRYQSRERLCEERDALFMHSVCQF